jgi:hypothetical protein
MVLMGFGSVRSSTGLSFRDDVSGFKLDRL